MGYMLMFFVTLALIMLACSLLAFFLHLWPACLALGTAIAAAWAGFWAAAKLEAHHAP